MLPYITLLSLLLSRWCYSFLYDQGAKEHLASRFNYDEYMSQAIEIEESGEVVYAVDKIARKVRRRIILPWFPLALVLSLGILIAKHVESTLLVTFVTATWVGTFGALEYLGVNLGMRKLYFAPRTFRQRLILFAGLLGRCAIVFAAMLAIHYGLRILANGWSITGLRLLAIAVLLLAGAHWPSRWATKRANAMEKGIAFAENADDETVLMLRAFSDDSHDIRSIPFIGPLSPLVPGERIRFEELISLSVIAQGRLVAIGKPGEKLPELGAARTYWADQNWKDAIRRTALRCKAVVLIAETSEGLKWEMESLREWGVSGKTLILIPPDADQTRSTARFIEAIKVMTGRAPRPDEIHPAFCTAIHIRTDGSLTHYISDGRDWAAYLTTIKLFFSILSGNTREANVEATTNSTKQTPDAFREPENQSTPPKPVRNPMKVQVEISSHITLWRLVATMRSLALKTDAGAFQEASIVLEKGVRLALQSKGYGWATLLTMVLAEELIEQGDFDEAEILLERAREYSLKCALPISLFGELLQPRDIRHIVLIQMLGLTKQQGNYSAHCTMLDTLATQAHEDRMFAEEFEYAVAAVDLRYRNGVPLNKFSDELERLLKLAERLGDPEKQKQCHIRLARIAKNDNRELDYAFHARAAIRLDEALQ